MKKAKDVIERYNQNSNTFVRSDIQPLIEKINQLEEIRAIVNDEVLDWIEPDFEDGVEPEWFVELKELMNKSYKDG